MTDGHYIWDSGEASARKSFPHWGLPSGPADIISSLRANAQMGSISAEHVPLRCICGVREEERHEPTALVANLTVKYDLAECICSDEIGSAVDYSAVAAEAVAFAKKTQFRLLEKLADALCRHLLIAFPRALTIWLRLQKSRTAIGEAGTSFYCSICRRRALAIVRLRSDSCRTLDEASRRLMAVPHCRFLRSSSTYRTAQLHLTERQEFFSRSLLIETPLSSAELLREMDAVGPVLGCLRSGCGRSNPVDMDLLLFEGIDFSSLAIAVPGWRLRSRRFPVEELADLGLAPMVEMENASISRQWCEKVKDLPDSNR